MHLYFVYDIKFKAVMEWVSYRSSTGSYVMIIGNPTFIIKVIRFCVMFIISGSWKESGKRPNKSGKKDAKYITGNQLIYRFYTRKPEYPGNRKYKKIDHSLKKPSVVI